MLNVKFGRWKNVAQSISDIALGKFGRTPGPIDPDLLKLVLEKTGLKQIEGRPADVLAPRMSKLREELVAKNLPADDEACVLHAMFPVEFAKLHQKSPVAGAVPDVAKTPAVTPVAGVASVTKSSAPVAAGQVQRFGLTINGRRTEVSVAELV